jgi:hypothetical protein
MNKFLFPLAIALFLAVPLQGQIDDQEGDLREAGEELEAGWNIGGAFNLGFSQIYLSNWVAGGESSIAGNGRLNLFAGYRQDALIWINTIDLGYGLQKREDEDVRKTDDRIDLMSKLGLEAAENFYYAGLLNLRTQMAPGYAEPGDDTPISNFLSPGYLIGALGIDYRPVDNFSVFIAPLTGKITMVLDQNLADQGAYGVDPGDNFRSEFGSFLRADYRLDITDDIRFQTKLDLFSNYLDKPQNLDINWETLLMMRLTDYIGISFATHLIYDEDMVVVVPVNDTVEPQSPRVQFKQLFTLGFSYNF